jgi:hypothetical protein
MSAYSGTFTVVNCTGNSISNVSVTHTCASFTNAVSATSMAPGAGASQTLNSQTGSNDDWSITFSMGGTVYSRSGKQCNYEQEDAPQTCVIALYRDDFSVLTPVSSPCLNNYYSTPSSALGIGIDGARMQRV